MAKRKQKIELYPGVFIKKDPTPCEWFLLCDNEATMTRPHPVLGDVPICQRCNDKMESL